MPEYVHNNLIKLTFSWFGRLVTRIRYAPCCSCETEFEARRNKRRMSQQTVERVLGRLITDAEFRAKFFIEPAGVCRDYGLELTPVELGALAQVEEQALIGLATRLDPKIVRAMMLRVSGGEARLTVNRPYRARRSQRSVR